MKAVKWAFSHEPAIIAGIVAGIAVYFSLRYGTKADGALQGTTGGLVAALFGVLRNFVTSPATKASLAAGEGQIGPIADDVDYLRQFVGEAITHPSGLYGLLASHAAQVQQAIGDAEHRIMSVVHGNPVQPSEPPTTTTTQTLLEPTVPVDDAAASGGNITTVPEPSEVPTPAPEDPELVKLQGLVGS